MTCARTQAKQMEVILLDLFSLIYIITSAISFYQIQQFHGSG